MNKAAAGDRAADLRLPALAVVAWGAALATFLLPLPALLALVSAVLVGVGAARWRGRVSNTPVAWVLLGTAVVATVALQAGAVRHTPLHGLAVQRAEVDGVLVVASDPVLHRGRFGPRVLLRADVRRVSGRGHEWTLRAPVLVLAPTSWRHLRDGTILRATGRLAPARSDDLAAVWSATRDPVVVAGPGPLTSGAARVRAGIRTAVARQPPDARALVPGLVDGDRAGLPESVIADFRTCGLTHLLAVSGTNLTLVVGFVLLLARGLGVRGRGLVLVGFLGVAGFVLLARAEPSVLRAAAMGSVGLLGMGGGGRPQGTRAWGAAVLCLVLVDPWLATSPGFALSAAATAGILWLAPSWRDALCRWMPRWLAEAISVPLAAQLSCTPLVAALSGQVSLVAVMANMAVAPVVGPATVLGLTGGLVAVVSPGVGRVIALPAGWCARWIVEVAGHCAGLPAAAAPVGTSAPALVLLALVCLVLAGVLGRVLARRLPTVCMCCCLITAVVVPAPTPGWPPRGWVLVACDVGQGDGLVLRAGPGRGVVVDTGPDPAPMDACLDGLGIDQVPLIVLTHFHADHIGGLAGVLDGRQVGRIEVTTLREPASGARSVQRLARGAGVPVAQVRVGRTRRLGSLRWQVLAPSGPPPEGSDSPPNDASIVLYVRTRGTSILMMGDEETGSQERLAEQYPRLRADVLKVAHHGSAKQDDALVDSLDARLALISVGADNDYGHPAPSTLFLLHHAGMRVERTDLDGTVAVVVDHGLRVVEHGVGAP